MNKNEIIVFETNLLGRHEEKYLKMGAQFGNPFDKQGNTYAIPTVDITLKRKLPLSLIKIYVNKFLNYAYDRPDFEFFVEEMGCDSMYKKCIMAELFEEAQEIKNIKLSKGFLAELNKEY